MDATLLYARVSQQEQNQGDAVSIPQQLADMQALCERNGWHILATFVDAENYRATQVPNKGKIVNPSGERADRPALLAMLEMVKSGIADTIICWRDDRLVRHPRVAVALEDALDLGDTRRDGRGKIQILDATGSRIDRFMLSIKATIWREENRRRMDRTKMGKIGTLKAGRWPGHYSRLGYVAIEEPGRRGRVIMLADEEEIQTVRDIYDWYEAGVPMEAIRNRLIGSSAQQKGQPGRQHDWSRTLIHSILRAEDYTGRAVWHFGDGTDYVIEIPQIISHEQWKRVQDRRERNKQLSSRNSQGIYLLQGIIACGECGRKAAVQASRNSNLVRGGTRKRYLRLVPYYRYMCIGARAYPEEPHPTPSVWHGESLDWAVWRQIVDKGIKRPNLIREQVLARQAELQAQGENLDGEISHAQRKLAEVEQQRAFFQRQAARGKMTEQEFDSRMDETEETWQYLKDEIERLQELKDNTADVYSGLDYAEELLVALQGRLSEIDLTPEEVRKLPADKRTEVLMSRKEIVHALCDRVIVYASGQVEIMGVLDGSEAAQFELGGHWNAFHNFEKGDSASDLPKLRYNLGFSLAEYDTERQHRQE